MTEASAQTVGVLVQIGKDNDVALAAPGRPPLNYAGLRRQASATAAALSVLGIERSDRVTELTGDGMRISLRCRNSNDSAIKPVLPRTGIRVLPVRPQGKGAARRA